MRGEALGAAVPEEAARLEAIAAELAALEARLGKLSLWRPAAGLRALCADTLRAVRSIAARRERPLVAVLVGPSGAGKSTLVNAFAGGEEIAAAGRRRPTTERAAVFASSAGEAEAVAALLGGEAAAIPAAGVPAGMVLVDTPDTDSIGAERHRAAVDRAVEEADLLLCVFDAENPKRRDAVDRLEPLVRRFDGRSVLIVVNKCDRLDEAESRGAVLDDFRGHLAAAWGIALEPPLAVSARRHLREPAWDPGAEPRHGGDRFAELRERLAAAAAGGRAERRLENALRLRELLFAEVEAALAARRPALEAARALLARAQAGALEQALAVLERGEGFAAGEAAALLQRKVAAAWSGPLGWLLLLWSRLSGPGDGILGRLAPWRAAARRRRAARFPFGDTPAAVGEAVRAWRLHLLAAWPEAAERLVAGGFDPAVRDPRVAEELAERQAAPLLSRFPGWVEETLEATARRFAAWPVQALFNAPVVGMLGWIGVEAVASFFRGRILPGDYFTHGFWATLLVGLLSFTVLQIALRPAGNPRRLLRRARARFSAAAARHLARLTDHPLPVEIEEVLRLPGAPAGPPPQGR